jgi:hypothetical protein
MSTRRKQIYGLSVAISGTIVVLLLLRPEDTDYHLRAFVYAITSPPRAASWRGRFTRDYLHWDLHGRPTEAKLRQLADYHESELLRLGGFERREFVLQHRAPGKSTRLELGAMITRLSSDRKWRMRFNERSPRFTITATPANMKVFEAAICEYDREVQ